MISDNLTPFTRLSRRNFLQLSAALGPVSQLQGVPAQDANPGPYKCIWLPEDGDSDSYVAFRGIFELTTIDEVEVRFLGASGFLIWLDGSYLAEGPARFIPAYPEYQSHRVRLSPGKHVLAAQVHYEGVATRLLPNPRPFLMCQVFLRDCGNSRSMESGPARRF